MYAQSMLAGQEKKGRLRCAWALVATLLVFGVKAEGQALPAALLGSLRGTVTDSDGALVGGAQVILASDATTPEEQTLTGTSGQFHFDGVAAGAHILAVTAPGLAPTTATLTLLAGQDLVVDAIVMRVATATTSVDAMTREQVAELEIKQQEQQRLFGFASNFFVSYNWNAQPLTKKQKFELSQKTLLDPIGFLIVGGIAGVEQAADEFPGYHQGAAGYGKRYGAAYADFAIGTVLGGSILPVVFKQDPRYFYMGTGTKIHRALYALSTAVIQRGDNGKWQPAYAGIVGDFGAGAISNLYYPASDRQGATLTVTNGFLSVLFDGIGNVVQEFVFRHVSTGVPKTAP